jgi:signal transduction protein with GAF and PtsI domain
MPNSIASSVIRILKPNGETVGAGFLVAPNLAVTCAHVVEIAGTLPGNPGQIMYRRWGESKTSQIYIAHVESNLWRASAVEDVAFLRLDTPLPEGISPALLGLSIGSLGHSFQTLGFPAMPGVDGLAGTGEILEITSVNDIRVLQIRSPEVTPGFSGAPVYDTLTRRVIGMVTAITPPDEYLRLAVTAFATPIETLLSICPELHPSEICPYRSLDAFREEDAPFFFGREHVVNKLLESLKREPRFLAVLGPSGSGKSSLVRAGLIPALRQGKIPGSQKWSIITIRPTNDPFEQLAGAGFINPQGGLESSVKNWFSDHQNTSRLVLVIDQFEEVLVSTPKDIRQKFIFGIDHLLNEAESITIVLTLRDDFYSRFLQEATLLAGRLERGLVNIPYILEQDDLRAIILKPASKVGLIFDDGLIETILDDTCKTEHSGEVVYVTILPLLEFALTQLWEYRQFGQLTRDSYKMVGGVTGGLTQWADKAYFKLDHTGRNIAKDIFINLVNIGDSSINLPDSRRRLSIYALYQTGYRQEEVDHVVQELATARLLITQRDSDHESVEIIHDALIREWGQLRQWIDENRIFLDWRQKLDNAIKSWSIKHYDDGALFHGAVLLEAETWLLTCKDRLLDQEIDFIRKSCKLRDREIENIRRLGVLESTIKNLNGLADVMAGAHSIQSLLDIIVNKLAETLKVDAISLYLADETEEILTITAATGYQRHLLDLGARYHFGEGLTGKIAETKKGYYADSFAELSMIDGWYGKYNAFYANYCPESFYGIPLMIEETEGRNRTIGVLKTESLQKGLFSDDVRFVINMMGSFIVTVIYNVQIEAKRFDYTVQSLQHLAYAMVGAKDLGSLLDNIVNKLTETLNADAISLYLADETGEVLTIAAASGYQKPLLDLNPKANYLLGEGVTGKIAKEQHGYRTLTFQELCSIGNRPKGKYDDFYIANHQPQSFYGIPLMVAEKTHAIGVLKVESLHEDFFSNDTSFIINMMGNFIATVVYNTQLTEKQFINLSNNIQTLSSALAGGRTLAELLEQIVTTFGEILQADAASIYLLNEASGNLEIRAGFGYMKPLVERGASYRLGEGVTGKIAAECKPINVKNSDELRKYRGEGMFDELQQTKYPNAFMGFPLVIKDHAIGVLKAESFSSARFSNSDLLLGQMLANIIATVIYNAQHNQS